jgi:hypothetical protein
MPSKTPRVIVGLFFAACATVVCAVSAWPVVHSASAVIAGIAAGFALVLGRVIWVRRQSPRLSTRDVGIEPTAFHVIEPLFASPTRRVPSLRRNRGLSGVRIRPADEPRAVVPAASHHTDPRPVFPRTRGLAEHRSAISLRSLN